MAGRTVPRCHSNDRSAMPCGYRTGEHDESTIRLACKCSDVVSISAASRTPTGVKCTLNDGAAASIVRTYAAQDGFAGSKTSATRLTPGAHSLISSNHFPPIENSKLVKPVMLPSGRAKFVTKPAATGSGTCTNTIGMERVCAALP